MVKRVPLLVAIVATLGWLSFPVVSVAGPEPDYGDFRGPSPTAGQGTDGKSYRRNTYGEVGTGASLPGSLGGSTATVPEGLMNSGSYGLPAPGSGIDVLHQDEMKRLRYMYKRKKAIQKEAKANLKGTRSSDSGTTESKIPALDWPNIVIEPGELTTPLASESGVRPAGTPRRSVVRDHAVAAHPNTPGQGGVRRDRSIPSTSFGPRLPAFPANPGQELEPVKGNVAGVSWGRIAQ